MVQQYRFVSHVKSKNYSHCLILLGRAYFGEVNAVIFQYRTEDRRTANETEKKRHKYILRKKISLHSSKRHFPLLFYTKYIENKVFNIA
jgi:hypothetical protein